MSYDTALTRQLYWISTCISLSAPFLGNWVMLVWYVIEAAINGLKFYGTKGDTFIVVKIIMVFIYDVVLFFFAWEMCWYILDWWQKLEGLESFVPYERPTEAEVAKGDYV